MEYRLLLALQLYGLQSKKIELEYKKDNLSNIDHLTFSYLNEQEFFLKNKSEINRKIAKSLTFFELTILPVSFELSENGVYIEDSNFDKKHALFQQIKIKQNETYIKNIVKNKIMKGKLLEIYNIEKYILAAEEEYESIFDNCPSLLLKQIELNFFTPYELEQIYCFFEKKSRFTGIIRLILSNNIVNIEDILKLIPFKEKENQEIILTRHVESDNIRLPYKEDE